MAEKLDKTNDDNDEGAGWLTDWEKEGADEWERNVEVEDTLRQESEASAQKLWSSFQTAATTISHLFKERCQENELSLWQPFQNSAAAVTNLYKESQQCIRKSMDIGMQYGHHKRTREVLSWARKRHRNIRREDLIAYLLDKTPPKRSKPSAAAAMPLTGNMCRLSVDRSASPHQVPRFSSAAAAVDTTDNSEPDLQPFRDALALQGLNGAMSNIRMNGQQGGDRSTFGASAVDNFDLMLLEQISRCCSGSRRRRGDEGSHSQDSPTRKRSRHF